jgi:alkylhydroperoxidase family enzyme
MDGVSGDLAHCAGPVVGTMGTIVDSAWAEATRSGRADLLELVGAVCADQHGLPPLRPPGGRTTGRWDGARPGLWRSLEGITPAERAALEFAEQFSVDVSRISASQRTAVFDDWGPEAATLAALVFVMDFVPRTWAALDGLASVFGTERCEPTTSHGDLPIWEALDGLIRTVPRLDALDPVTSELVRLRGARQHHCRICQSLRSRPAVLAGADELLLSELDDFESSTLSAHRRAALAMVDAMIWTPGRLDAAVDRLVANASPEQCVEVVADVTRNALNKVAVALGADAPHVQEGVEFYDIDPEGGLVYGVTLG